jgi:ankyrin repeat protein
MRWVCSVAERGHTPSGEVPEGITALIGASRNAHLPAVNFLLSKGVEIDAQVLKCARVSIKRL